MTTWPWPLTDLSRASSVSTSVTDPAGGDPASISEALPQITSDIARTPQEGRIQKD